MSSTFTRRRIISTHTLLAVLVSAASGYVTTAGAAATANTATAAAAAPANKLTADRSLSESANAGYVAFSAKSPTLTSDIGQPRVVAERQLPVGFGLLAGGLLGLVYGLVTLLLPRRRTIARAV